MSQSAPSLAEQVPYPFMTAHEAKDFLVEQLLYAIRKPGDEHGELRLKIENYYKRRFGVEMLPIETSRAQPICLHGQPGMGKTTSIREAAKEVAKALNMKPQFDPSYPYMPQPHDLVVTTLEMSGEVSNIVLGGIPVADQIGKQDPMKFMNKLPLYSLAVLSNASAGVLVLDDFVNAAPAVQNSALSIALEGRFQMFDLGNVYVAMTANLGALDNSDTNPLSGPMLSRIAHFYVEDVPEDFMARARTAYPDGLGDCGVSAFIATNRDYFILPMEHEGRIEVAGMRAPYPCSRSWDKLTNALRIYFNRARSEESGLSMSRIALITAGFVGKATAEKFAAFTYANMTGAEPIARRLIETGELDEKMFEAKYKEGLALDAQQFGYQMAFSLASHASAAIAGGKDLKETIHRMCKAVYRLDAPTIGVFTAAFGGRLKALMREKISQMDQTGQYPLSIKPDYIYELTGHMSDAYIKIHGSPMSRDLADNIADAITGADRRAELFNSKAKKIGAQKSASPSP